MKKFSSVKRLSEKYKVKEECFKIGKKKIYAAEAFGNQFSSGIKSISIIESTTAKVINRFPSPTQQPINFEQNSM